MHNSSYAVKVSFYSFSCTLVSQKGNTEWREINQLPALLGQEVWLKQSRSIPTERKAGESCAALCPARGSGFFGKLLFNFPGSSDGKESSYNAGDSGLTPRAPGEGNGNPLQYSCLENSLDGGAWRAWQATVHGVTKSQTQLSD